jgi:hypothetical protein
MAEIRADKKGEAELIRKLAAVGIGFLDDRPPKGLSAEQRAKWSKKFYNSAAHKRWLEQNANN